MDFKAAGICKIFFEGKTQEEVRKEYGIEKSSMVEAMDRIYATLRKFLKKFFFKIPNF